MLYSAENHREHKTGFQKISEILENFEKKRKCVYYIILSDQDTTMAFLSSLFFSLMFIRLTRYADSRPGGGCDVPVNLILDEFNNIGRIGGAADGSDFARSLSVIRSRDIRVMMAVQSLGQLQNRYGNNLWAEIIGNCDIQLMLGCTDDITAEYFSARSGEMSIEVDSTMTTRQTIAPFQVIPQYRETQGQGRRKLLTADEILRLSVTEMLCVIRGCNILKLNKMDYTKHPMSGQMVKCSIMDYYPEHEIEAVSQTGMETDTDDAGQRDDVQENLQDALQRTAPVEMVFEVGTGKEEQDSRKDGSGTVMDTEAVPKKQLPQTDFEQLVREECERERRPPADRVPKKKKLYSSARPPEDF